MTGTRPDRETVDGKSMTGSERRTACGKSMTGTRPDRETVDSKSMTGSERRTASGKNMTGSERRTASGKNMTRTRPDRETVDSKSMTRTDLDRVPVGGKIKEPEGREVKVPFKVTTRKEVMADKEGEREGTAGMVVTCLTDSGTVVMKSVSKNTHMTTKMKPRLRRQCSSQRWMECPNLIHF